MTHLQAPLKEFGFGSTTSLKRNALIALKFLSKQKIIENFFFCTKQCSPSIKKTHNANIKRIFKI